MQQQWLKLRLERVLPALMRKHGVAMWLVICREYNEDPVFWSLVSPTTFAARRTTILVFHDQGPEKGVERLALGGGDQGGLYTAYRDKQTSATRELYLDAQWAALRKVVEERRPASIAVNISPTHAFSDGLSVALRDQLVAALGAEWSGRLKPTEQFPLEFVETRLPEMLPIYRQMMELSHDLIRRAFSGEVITPGTTTDHDVVWWLREQVAQRGLTVWFQPSIRLQRPTKTGLDFLNVGAPTVIQQGDVLHVDFGFTAARLATDTQHMGYVLRTGETEVPAGIREALRNAQRLQDIVLAEMRPGRTGNEVLAAARDRMKSENINGTIYTHPIGDHGHGAGPLIGLWDRQQAIPGKGDVPLKPNTWFSIELGVRTAIPEWGNQDLFVGMEEDAELTSEGKMRWILRRQEQYHLVRASEK